jgi:Ras-related GTP-binding protein C/D
LESTNKIIKDDISNSSFVQFQIWDFPGQIDFFDPTFDSDMIFGGCGALVFVIDAQVGRYQCLQTESINLLIKVNKISFRKYLGCL